MQTQRPSLEWPERDDLQHLFPIGQSHTRGGAPQVRLQNCAGSAVHLIIIDNLFFLKKRLKQEVLPRLLKHTAPALRSKAQLKQEKEKIYE